MADDHHPLGITGKRLDGRQNVGGTGLIDTVAIDHRNIRPVNRGKFMGFACACSR